MVRAAVNGNPWALADAVAHVLYCPLLLGRRHGRSDWRTRVHLIPGAAPGWVCDRYDASLEPRPHVAERRERSEPSKTIFEGTPRAMNIPEPRPDAIRRSEIEFVGVVVRAAGKTTTFELADEPTYEIPWLLWKALCDAQHAVDLAEMEIMRYVADHYPAADEAREWVREYDV